MPIKIENIVALEAENTGEFVTFIQGSLDGRQHKIITEIHKFHAMSIDDARGCYKLDLQVLTLGFVIKEAEEFLTEFGGGFNGFDVGFVLNLCQIEIDCFFGQINIRHTDEAFVIGKW